MPSEIAHVDNLSVAARHLRKQTVSVADLEPIRRAIGFPQLDGVVGFDALASHYVKVDVDRKTLTMSDVPIAAPRNAHVVSYHVRGGLLQVEAAVDGEHAQFMVDTGDRSALTIFQPFARANGFYGITPVQRNAVTG